jgi:hypothetical protein
MSVMVKHIWLVAVIDLQTLCVHFFLQVHAEHGSYRRTALYPVNKQ